MSSRFFRLPFVALALAASFAHAQPTQPSVSLPGAASSFTPETYSGLGYVFGETSKFRRLGWTEAQFEAFVIGLRDSFQGKARQADPRVQALHEEMNRRVQQMAQADAQLAAQAAAGFFKDPANLAKYMKDTSAALKLEMADSGYAFAVRGQSGSAKPKLSDTVVITRRVRGPDGRTELPQISTEHEQIKVADLPPALKETVQKMTIGSTAMLLVPPALTYGDGPWPAGVIAGAPLFYALTLEKIVP